MCMCAVCTCACVCRVRRESVGVRVAICAAGGSPPLLILRGPAGSGCGSVCVHVCMTCVHTFACACAVCSRVSLAGLPAPIGAAATARQAAVPWRAAPQGGQGAWRGSASPRAPGPPQQGRVSGLLLHRPGWRAARGHPAWGPGRCRQDPSLHRTCRVNASRCWPWRVCCPWGLVSPAEHSGSGRMGPP